MTQWISKAPSLCPISQCDTSLDFTPRSGWPEGLPAVAVNKTVLAGFQQSLVFNHEIPIEQSEAIASLFRSLYFELTVPELARLNLAAKSHSWFPVREIFKKLNTSMDLRLEEIFECVLKLPVGFQNWCSEKKLGPQDLSPLLSAKELDLKPLYLKILKLALSKSQGVQALELGIEILLMGKSHSELALEATDNLVADEWLTLLKTLRFPETTQLDSEGASSMSKLPWPGKSQARWIRQGDRAGIELKLFVSNPTDLKKYIQSLSKVHEQLERDLEKPKLPH